MLFALAVTATLLAPDPDTTFNVQRGQRLELNTHSGDIVVHTWAAVRSGYRHPARGLPASRSTNQPAW